MTKSGNIKHSDLCLSVVAAEEGERVKLKICDNSELQVCAIKLSFSLNVSNLEMEVYQSWQTSSDPVSKLVSWFKRREKWCTYHWKLWRFRQVSWKLCYIVESNFNLISELKDGFLQQASVYYKRHLLILQQQLQWYS